MRLISQLIKDISRVLQRLLKYFNGTIISTSFFCLNLIESLLILPVGKLAIASLSSKNGSSLNYYHKLPYVFE